MMITGNDSMNKSTLFQDSDLANAIDSDETEWAKGCQRDECHHGLIAPPPPPATADLWLGRVAQYRLGLLVFCDCRAGAAQAKLMERREENIVMGLKNDCVEKAGAWGAGEWNAFI